MKIMSVVGARPNFMKISPIIRAIDSYNNQLNISEAAAGDKTSNLISHVLVHTGQHYDKAMSDSFFEDLKIPMPDISLGVGSGTHASQAAEIMKRFEPVLLDQQPDVMIVVGDVNSTAACALVAAKIDYDGTGRRPLIAHVEAGLRSFDRSMPEEINRIVTDHLSDLLFVTERSGIENLKREGVPEEKIFFVGNTMIDTLMASRELATRSNALGSLGLVAQNGGSAGMVLPYALLTLHRPSNVDNRETFLEVMSALQTVSEKMPVIFPVHPRTRKQIAAFRIGECIGLHYSAPVVPDGGGKVSMNGAGGIHITDPLGYLDFLCLMTHAKIVLTDSGGIQEETTCLGVPCVTIRENTERPVTVTNGTNMLCGLERQSIIDTVNLQLNRSKPGSGPELWDGNAASRIIAVIAGGR